MRPLLPFSLNQPLSVDNAISTIGAIHKLINKINEVIKEINNIDSKANEYTDEQIALLKSELQITFNELETLISSLSGRVDGIDSQIEGIFVELTAMRNIMNTNFNNINNHIDEVNTSLTLQLQNNYVTLYHYIDSQIDMIEQLINAQNPEIIDCFGHKNKLQYAYNNLVDALMYSNGGGTFEKVLNKIKNFTFSTYVNMQNVSFYSFVTAMSNTPSNNRVVYYLNYSNTNLSVYTQKLASFKELITNITSCMIILYKYGKYNNTVPLSESTNFQTALRNEFFVLNQYEPVTFNATLNDNLR